MLLAAAINWTCLALRLGARVAIALAALLWGAVTAAGEPQYVKVVSSQLNSSGKAVTLSVPFRSGDLALGDIVVTIEPDDSILIPKSALSTRLVAVLDKAAGDRLAAVPDQGGEIALSALKSAGFNLRFDRSQLVLEYLPTIDDSNAMNLSLGGGPNAERYTGAAARTPAAISGYINLGVGLENTWAYGSTPDQIGMVANIEPVLRSQDIVWEGNQTGGLKRSDTRAIYDSPADLVCFEGRRCRAIGDDFPDGNGYARHFYRTFGTQVSSGHSQCGQRRLVVPNRTTLKCRCNSERGRSASPPSATGPLQFV
jgi:hypothetical protein